MPLYAAAIRRCAIAGRARVRGQVASSLAKRRVKDVYTQCAREYDDAAVEEDVERVRAMSCGVEELLAARVMLRQRLLC